MKRLLILLFFLCSGLIPVPGQSDTACFYVIDSIRLEGNRITRPGIILRELTFSAGDTIPCRDLSSRIRQSRENVFNTSLFTVVDIKTDSVSNPANPLLVTVTLIERWYIWPVPYIEFPNRNITAWLETFDLSRLTAGIDLKFFNARGRNETLTLLVHLGFNQQYGFTYKVPYLDRKQTTGIGFGGSYALSRDLITGTLDDKSVFLDTASGFLQEQIHGFAECYFRPGIHSQHQFSVSYDYFHFADTLLKIPGYVTEPAAFQQFFTLYYKFKLDYRDMKYYPLQGYYFDIELTKQGIFAESVNLFQVESAFRWYSRFSKRLYWASGLTVKISFPEEQPFFLQHGVGYGRDFIRGFELYSINGPCFGLLKNNLKYAVIPPRIGILPFLHARKFSVVPYGLFLNLFMDAGYVYNEESYVIAGNHLVNQFLLGYGIGIDFITYYDIVIDVNLTMNSAGKPGFSLHFTAPI